VVDLLKDLDHGGGGPGPLKDGGGRNLAGFSRLQGGVPLASRVHNWMVEVAHEGDLGPAPFHLKVGTNEGEQEKKKKEGRRREEKRREEAKRREE